MRLLLINAFKGLKKRKIQTFALILIIILSITIYSTMNMSLDKLENSYKLYLSDQKIEDFSFIPQVDFEKDYSIKEIEKLETSKFKSATNEEKNLLTLYKTCLVNKCLDDITKNNLNFIFIKYNAYEDKQKEKLDKTASKYKFIYEKEYSKSFGENSYIYKAIYNDTSKNINKPYLVEGTMPNSSNEITVLETFAQENDLNINDTYKINNTKYKISGIAYAPQYIYPILSFSTPFYDVKHHTVLYLTKEGFNKVEGIQEADYIGRFIDRDNIKTQKKILFNIKNNLPYQVAENKAESIVLSPMNIIREVRVESLDAEIKSDRLFAEYFLYLLLSISGLIIIVINKKRIDDEKMQIGILKSLGYKSYKIAISYLVYIVVGTIIGGVLGYLISLLISPYQINMFRGFFSIPIISKASTIKYLTSSILIPMSFLSIFSYLIALFMLRKKPLYLLREGSNLKVNIFSKLISLITRRMKFKSKFKYQLLSRSIGKLLIIVITSFSTGMLIVLTLIGMNLFNSLVKTSFDNLKFKYMVGYISPQTDIDKADDNILETNMKVVRVIINNKEKDIKDESVNINGMDSNNKYYKISDEDNKLILKEELKANEIVINKNLKEILKVNIGDKLIFNYNNKEYIYVIKDINNSFMGISGIVSRSNLCKKLNIDINSYNMKYTSNNKYKNTSKLSSDEKIRISSIFAIDDLRLNMENQLKGYNGTIYIIISFASLMALIIITVIANIVVEENKKIISLMKVMGYDNKTISKIVLNIYTPFVIISYLLAIPAMISLLKWIVSQLTKDIDIAIPVSISFTKAFIGLLGLLIGYYIAIYLSKRILNKISLSVALKRE